MSGAKTEQPTAKRRRESRREGRVAKSAELVNWAAVYLATILIGVTFRAAHRVALSLMEELPRIAEQPEPSRALALFGRGVTGALTSLVPLLLGLTAMGVLGNIAQIGLRVNGRLLKPKTERINPIAGTKRLFGRQAGPELVRTVAKMLIFGGLAYRAVAGFMPIVASGIALSSLLPVVADRALSLVRSVALAGLAIGAADYVFARRRHNKSLRMTKQEVKDEQRQSEGDPQLKQSIRGRQMRMARMRMMADVAKADVVIVNPTHVAVALRYDAAHGAPRVVGKGADAVAARIREVAATADVPLVEDVPLARTLHGSCEIGDEIPAELYESVARIIAFVYSLRRAPVPIVAGRVHQLAR